MSPQPQTLRIKNELRLSYSQIVNDLIHHDYEGDTYVMHVNHRVLELVNTPRARKVVSLETAWVHILSIPDLGICSPDYPS